MGFTAAGGDKNTKALGEGLAAVLDPNAKPWYKQRNVLILNIYLFCLLQFSSAGGYDGSMMNGVLALPQWYTFMNNPAGDWLGFITAANCVGAIIIYPIAPYISNKWGRKTTIWLGYVFLVVGVVIQSAAKNEAMFILGRILVGCPGAFWAAVPLLLTETAHPAHRSIITAMYNCGYYVGSTIAAGVTFGVRNNTTSMAWRIPSILQALLPVLILPAFFLCPESPRYLVAVGRHEEARSIITQYHANGDSESPLVEFEMTEIQTTIKNEQEAANSTSWADMFRGVGNRKRLFISVSFGIFAQWAGNGVVSYYLSLVLKTVGVTSVTQQLGINLGLNVWNLGFAVAAASVVDRVGRRPLLMTSSIVMLMSFICITGLSGSFANTGHAATGIAVIPFLFIFYAGYDLALTPLIVSYNAEIWPYSLRAKGLTVTFCSTYIALFFNIFINPIALDAIHWKYYFVFAVILAVMVITFYFFYPETRGYSLEEIAVIFDGESAAVPNTHATLQHVEEVEKRTSVSHIDYVHMGKE